MCLFITSQRLKDVQTLEELGDVYHHFLLYYGRDIPKMQNSAKATKKKLKKIKEVSEDGKTDEGSLMLIDGNVIVFFGCFRKNFTLLNYFLTVY